MQKTERLKAKMAEQRKISLEERCAASLCDPVLIEGMKGLLELCRELRMKPIWYHGASYKCYYKKRVVAYLSVYTNRHNKEVCDISVVTVRDDDNLNNYLNIVDNDMKDIVQSFLKTCICCTLKDGRPSMCSGGCDVEIDGILHKAVCMKVAYHKLNPTADEFMMIKRFIIARRKFIEAIT